MFGAIRTRLLCPRHDFYDLLSHNQQFPTSNRPLTLGVSFFDRSPVELAIVSPGYTPGVYGLSKPVDKKWCDWWGLDWMCSDCHIVCVIVYDSILARVIEKRLDMQCLVYVK